MTLSIHYKSLIVAQLVKWSLTSLEILSLNHSTFQAFKHHFVLILLKT